MMLQSEQDFKYILTSNLKELPEYGKHIVVLTMWDEWCRPPMYAHKVGSVLSTYGFHFDNYFSKPYMAQYNLIKGFKTASYILYFKSSSNKFATDTHAHATHSSAAP